MTSELAQRNEQSYHELYAGRFRGEAFEALNKARIVRSLVARTGLRRGSRVLDVGFGWGTALSELRRSGFATYGVEITANAVRAARDRLPASGLLVSDAGHLPFRAGSFDLVVCSHVLEHLDDDRAAVAEMARVLRAGGWMVLGVPGPGMLDHPLHFRNYTAEQLAATARPLAASTRLHRGGALYKLAGRVAVEANARGEAGEPEPAGGSRWRSGLRPLVTAALGSLAWLDDLLAQRDRRPEEIWMLLRRD